MGSRRKYVVLRAPADSTWTPFTAGVSPFEHAGRPAAEPELRVEELDKREVAERAREPATLAIAPDIPVTLPDPPAPDAASDPPESAAEVVWGVEAVGASTCRFDGSDVVVAVVDSGIDAAHDAFRGVELVSETFAGTTTHDDHGHGTHVAGTIFGREVEGNRIGVAPGVRKALIAKVLDEDGRGGSATLAEGLEWALQRGPHVINLSPGLDFVRTVRALESDGWPAELAMLQALDDYRSNVGLFERLLASYRSPLGGMSSIIVAAAGNDSRRWQNPGWEVGTRVPAVLSGVIAVGAVERDRSTGRLAVMGVSNTAPTCVAPGSRVLSANRGGGRRFGAGTSVAAPHVSGLACLWLQASREAGRADTPAHVTRRLLSAAKTDCFSTATDEPDRGLGLAVAPS